MVEKPKNKQLWKQSLKKYFENICVGNSQTTLYLQQTIVQEASGKTRQDIYLKPIKTTILHAAPTLHHCGAHGTREARRHIWQRELRMRQDVQCL